MLTQNHKLQHPSRSRVHVHPNTEKSNRLPERESLGKIQEVGGAGILPLITAKLKQRHMCSVGVTVTSVEDEAVRVPSGRAGGAGPGPDPGGLRRRRWM